MTSAPSDKKTEVGSYFISNYPPYSQWKSDQLPAVESALDNPPTEDTPLGLYLHIPFCRKRCKFCYFKVFTDVNAAEVQRYVDALCDEISMVSRRAVMGDRPFRFVYFGGGTPSFLSPKQLTKLADRLRQHITWDGAEEVTFECEPGTLSETKVKTLREVMGVTRLSLGVENFTDAILEENGRAHLSKQVFAAWEWIEAAGFNNVNIDLIAGMVGETWDNWKFNVQKALEMSPESLTIYQMELPYNTVYSADILGNQSESPVADWGTKRDWVRYAFDEFTAAGYAVSSAYTLVKDPQKVNFSYRDNLWKGADLLATGIASFGHASGVHYQNLPHMDQYLSTIESGQLPLGRGFVPTDLQKLIREMILLLKRGYLELDYFRNKFDVDVLDRWRDVWDGYVESGLATIGDDRVELTSDGLLQVDSMLPAFFEPEHQNVRYT
ncbi:coproporphyrinogen-III oxidase family protein [Crateriforma conspicua]|uniref:Oxygen-independent coproporphyrinogen-III oxidase 1 n=1 Tax=Crateriforma conspicua TaxID=2527996 RepID=A0A5C5Y2N0_9PLAN|nr:coproporphyrinogen-III oxidase family protein [Crateriforma conspicua]QDV63697.1 Oxygen-independent coproporphyrinogen-III oxidase 1 [Crateriforma conspicua]TWT69079.1 Oxygen-independent coproporphyrinogen-III oxidase 1 [Crateriforma conspicua]